MRGGANRRGTARPMPKGGSSAPAVSDNVPNANSSQAGEGRRDRRAAAFPEIMSLLRGLLARVSGEELVAARTRLAELRRALVAAQQASGLAAVGALQAASADDVTRRRANAEAEKTAARHQGTQADVWELEARVESLTGRLREARRAVVDEAREAELRADVERLTRELTESADEVDVDGPAAAARDARERESRAKAAIPAAIEEVHGALRNLQEVEGLRLEALAELGRRQGAVGSLEQQRGDAQRASAVAASELAAASELRQVATRALAARADDTTGPEAA